jgi:hypothetical protein
MDALEDGKVGVAVGGGLAEGSLEVLEIREEAAPG